MKKSTLTPNELAVMMVTELRQFRFELDDILIVQVESEQVGTDQHHSGFRGGHDRPREQGGEQLRA
jgi:hypothetical protein